MERKRIKAKNLGHVLKEGFIKVGNNWKEQFKMAPKREELKTLKDLNLFDDDLKDDIAKEKLKAEAIKWLGMIDNPLTDREVAVKLDLYNKCKTQEEIQNCLFGARRLLIVQNNLIKEDNQE